MSAETPEHPLVRAISELYDVFDGYVIQNPEPCPTCYSAEEVRYIGRRIRTVPLRDLTLDDIGHFYGDGLLTWGDADDFRYLLPRLMELFAAWHTGVPAIEPDESELRARGLGVSLPPKRPDQG